MAAVEATTLEYPNIAVAGLPSIERFATETRPYEPRLRVKEPEAVVGVEEVEYWRRRPAHCSPP
jgi:hypothetical protein